MLVGFLQIQVPHLLSLISTLTPKNESGEPIMTPLICWYSSSWYRNRNQNTQERIPRSASSIYSMINTPEHKIEVRRVRERGRPKRTWR